MSISPNTVKNDKIDLLDESIDNQIKIIILNTNEITISDSSDSESPLLEDDVKGEKEILEIKRLLFASA